MRFLALRRLRRGVALGVPATTALGQLPLRRLPQLRRQGHVNDEPGEGTYYFDDFQGVWTNAQ
jgi:hypothetical protein